MKKAKEMNARTRSRRCLAFEALESRNLLDASGVFVANLQDALRSTAEDSERLGAVGCECVGECVESDVIPIVAIETEESSEGWYSLADSSLNPSADEQELLEQINRFRTDPQGELARIFSVYESDALVARNSLVGDAIKLNSYPKNSIPTFLNEWSSLSSTSPLAFSSALNSAAASHSSYMRQKNDVSHRCAGEDELAVRLAKAGFISGISSEDGQDVFGENIGGSFLENGGFSVASYMLSAFAVDWGVPTHDHRDTMINASYTEVGISVLQTAKLIGPYVVTCDFGSSVDGARTDGAYLLGVVYDDVDEDLFYDVGEGVRNATIVIERLDGSDDSVTISSWNSGGYQIFLTNGDYRVTVISSDSFANSISKTVSIGDGINQKVDFRTSDVGESAPVVDLNGNAEGVDLVVDFKEGSEEPFEPLKDLSLIVDDADSNFLYGAKIYFGSRPDGDSEIVDVSVAGTNLRANFKEKSGYVEITGEGTISEYRSVIASLSYYNSLELCDLSAERTLLISVYDGAYWSPEAKLVINVVPATLPNLSVSDLEVYEGDSGTKVVYFDVTLDQPARVDVSFELRVSDGGSAIEGLHYVLPQGDPIVVHVGETSARLECYIVGNYDPLKPEGLNEVDGRFEKPFVDFYLEVINVKNAEIADERSTAHGIIYDDDSPIVLGVAKEYAYDRTLDVETGLRRYNFTLKPGASGLYTWNADSFEPTETIDIAVRKGTLDSEPIASSKIVANGARVQWKADPSIEYWITVESTADIAKITARLLEFVDDQTVLIDPLMEDLEVPQLVAAWGDDGFEIGVGDWTWDWSGDDWNGLSFRTTRPNVEFVADIPTGSRAALSYSDDDSGANLELENDRTVNFSGISSFVYNGNDNNEELVLTGSTGDDYLYYSNGTGYLQTSDGQTIAFNGVNKVSVNGGGGSDYAYVEDSKGNDRLTTTNSSVTASGGGYELTATYFAKSLIVFNQGGEDEFYATDSGEDVVMSLANGSTICRGTYLFESDVDEGAAEETAQSETIEYSRIIRGAESTIISPTDYVGTVELNDGLSTSSMMTASIGVLTRNDPRCRSSVSIERAKNLTINGVHQFADSRFTLNTRSEYESYVEDGYLTIVDPTAGWKLRAPSWKSATEVDSDVDAENIASDSVGNDLELLSSVLLDGWASESFVLIKDDEEDNVLLRNDADVSQIDDLNLEEWNRSLDFAFEDFDSEGLNDTSFFKDDDDNENECSDVENIALTLDPFALNPTITSKKRRASR